MNATSPDILYQAFANHGPAIQAALIKIAMELFGALAIIELTLSIGRAVANKTDILDIILLCTNQLLTIGFYLFLMQGWAGFAKAITDSFAQAGGLASIALGGTDTMMPVGMIMAGANIAKHVWSAMSFTSPVLSVLLAANGIIVICVFCWFAALMFEVLIECFFAAYVGIIMMAFGANSYTRDMALSQVRYAISVGVKRLTMQLIAGVASAIVIGWATAIENDPASVGWLDMALMIGVPIVILRLAQTQPKIAQDCIMGTHLSGHGSLITTASSVAKAATALATAVTGAGAAIGAGAALASKQMGGMIAAGTAPTSRIGQAAVMSRMAIGATGRAMAADVGQRLTGNYQATHGSHGWRVASALSKQKDRL